MHVYTKTLLTVLQYKEPFLEGPIGGAGGDRGRYLYKLDFRSFGIFGWKLSGQSQQSIPRTQYAI